MPTPIDHASYQHAMKVPPAPDLSHALNEARAIADGVMQPVSSGHLLLAFFTTPNPAEVILREHGVNEDTLLALFDGKQTDAPGALAAALDAADETALRCDARQTNTLHLLVALLRAKDTLAYVLLERALENVVGGPTQLRNRVMSFLTGVLPRRLMDPMKEAKLHELEPHRKEAMPPRAPRPLRQQPGDDVVVTKPRTQAPQPAAAPQRRGSEVRVLDEKAPRKSKVPERAKEPNDDDKPFARADANKKRRAEPPPSLTMPPTAYDLDPERFPWLCSLGRNLTAVAQNGGLDPSIGRERELEQLIDVLGKRRANNPCLIGEPGVGKTAIVEGLAVRLARKDPSVAPLFGKVIIELDMGRITAGTSLRGSFSERMQGLKRDVLRAKGQVIVFIDEIHTLMGAGASGDGPQDGANELKAALARGDFPCIGSTTLDEFKKHVAEDPALERRFVTIAVEEPDDASAIAILKGAAPLYAAHHGVEVDLDGICAAVQLSSRFIHDKRLPAKALDLLDLSLSRARRSGVTRVGREHVARVCADVANVPIERALLEDGRRFLTLERFLSDKVMGHEHVIQRVANTIRRNYAGFQTHRPLGSFLFLGPSGVGKTELAKALADFLYGTDKALLRFDMSEFSEPHTVARLVGAPPGYVGHQDGGQLTDAIKKRPHAVVLLDEVEKAHADVLPLLLQVLDEGRLTDARGRTVTFRHALLILTSNLGAQAVVQRGRVGFGAPSTIQPAEDARKKRETAVLDAARRHFAPELWGRIEDKMVFDPLTREQLMRIAGVMLLESSKGLETSRNISLAFDEGVLGYLVNQGQFDASTGARPMRQVVQRYVEMPVAEAILRGEVLEGARIRLSLQDGQLVAKTARPKRVDDGKQGTRG